MNAVACKDPYDTAGRRAQLAPVVRRLDNTIQRINRYPVDKVLRKQTTL